MYSLLKGTKVSEKGRYKKTDFSITKFNDDHYKIVWHKLPQIEEGWEEQDNHYNLLMPIDFDEDVDWFSKPEIEFDDFDINTERFLKERSLLNSLHRTKRTIRELYYCNKWDYFVTLTLDKEKQDRKDVKKFIKRFNQLLRDLRRRNNIDIDYLIVPELHQDESYHFHGFFNSELSKELTINEYGYLDWARYRRNYGFVNIQELDQDKDSKELFYILKYISKGMYYAVEKLSTIEDIEKINGIGKEDNLYYCTQGLKRPVKCFVGSTTGNVRNFFLDHGFNNDYVSILEVNKEDLILFMDSFGYSFD